MISYDTCVFAAAAALHLKYKMQASFYAAEFSKLLSIEGDQPGAAFWLDVIRALEVMTEQGVNRIQ